MRDKTKYLWPFFTPLDLLCIYAWATDRVSQLSLNGLRVEIFSSSDTKWGSIIGSWVVMYTFTLACIFMDVPMASWARLCQGWTSHLLYQKLKFINIVRLSSLLKWFKVSLSSQKLKSLMSIFRVSLATHYLFY